MRAYAVHRLQMLCMHQKSGKLIPVQFQPEKHAAAYIIDSAFHGPVHGFRMVIVIVFRPGGMKL